MAWGNEARNLLQPHGPPVVQGMQLQDISLNRIDGSYQATKLLDAGHVMNVVLGLYTSSVVCSR
jgi:hypothetical protein